MCINVVCGVLCGVCIILVCVYEECVSMCLWGLNILTFKYHANLTLALHGLKSHTNLTPTLRGLTSAPDSCYGPAETGQHPATTQQH